MKKIIVSIILAVILMACSENITESNPDKNNINSLLYVNQYGNEIYYYTGSKDSVLTCDNIQVDSIINYKQEGLNHNFRVVKKGVGVSVTTMNLIKVWYK